MTQQEVYPSAPLALVAAEVRYPQTPEIFGRGQFLDLKQALAEAAPIAEEGKEQSFTISMTATEAPTMTEQAQYRFASRDRTSVVVLTNSSLIVETTEYAGYQSFRPLLARAIEALEKVARPSGLLRVGLRYLDEIRVPTIVEPPGDWTGYLHPALLTVLQWTGAVDGLSVASWQSVAEMQHESGTDLVVRYGPKFGYAVNPQGPTRRKLVPPPGPFYLIDIDSSWQAGEEVPEFSGHDVLKTSDTLHEPVRSIFESIITDKLRNEVLRRQQ